ncbi:MAG: LamG-like jellyroll fold domain-containing protein [Chloroflexota bacterium]
MNLKQRLSTRIYLILALIGLLILTFWPSFVTAMPLTAGHRLTVLWQAAGEAEHYHYRTDVVQTVHPLAAFANAGRPSKTTHMAVAGQLDRANEAMRMDLWPQGKTSQRKIELKAEDGLTYRRVNENGDWLEVDHGTIDLFAPGGDPLGFLVAAENIQEVDFDTSETGLDAGLESLRSERHQATTRFTFDLDGLTYARFMNGRMEDYLRRKGELPGHLSLSLNRQYIDMIGSGEIWVNANGLPTHQTIHLEFPPDRGAKEWVEATISTDFFDWEQQAQISNFVGLFRLWESPPDLPKGGEKQFGSPLWGARGVFYFPSPRTLHHLGLILGATLLLIALTLIIVTQRHSRKFYAIIVGSVILSLLVTPFLQANATHAFNERQHARQAEFERQQASVNVGQSERDFNPKVDPLARPEGDLTSRVFGSGERYLPPLTPPAGKGSTYSPLAGGSEGGRDFQSDSIFESTNSLPSNNNALIPSAQTLITTTRAYTTGFDSDGDGLTDEIELLELGTNPNSVDTDGDGISDLTEVEGFNDGSQWYLNPLDADSNGDGLIDLAECENLGDVDEDGNLTTSSGSKCPDTDNDDVPDVFDFDNDSDGVPDAVDSAPNYRGSLTTQSREMLSFNLTDSGAERMVSVNFEIRPTDADHLWFTNNVLDWPDNDTNGQIMRVTSDTLHDNGDIMLSPMLEIKIPYDAANPSRGLPISDTVNINMITSTAHIDTWLDTATLDEYGITVSQAEGSSILYAYVPLVLIEDTVGNMPVAWTGQMLYTLNSAASGWGADHQVRLVWFVTAQSDYCDTSGIPANVEFDDYCSANKEAHWVSENSIIQRYYEDFYVTGLYTKEDFGLKGAIIAQTDAATATYENFLWHLADGLQQTFIKGEVDGGATRFDIAEIETRFDKDSNTYADGAAERWGIPKTSLDVTAIYTYPDQITGLEDLGANQVPNVLNTTYPGVSANTHLTLLLAREETYKSTVLGGDGVSSSSSTEVSISLSGLDQKTYASLNWAPYVYDGLVWDSADLEDYLDHLDTQLSAAIDINALLAGETVEDETVAEDGAVSLAKHHYMAFFTGMSDIVAVNGVAEGSETIIDADYALSGDPVETYVAEMATLLRTLFEDENSIQLDTQALNNQVVSTFTQGEFLESLGQLSNGTLNAKSKQASASIAFVVKELFKKFKEIKDTKTIYGKRAQTTATGLSLLAVGTLIYLDQSDVDGGHPAYIAAYGALTAAGGAQVVAAIGRLDKYRSAVSQIDKLNIEKTLKVGVITGLVIEAGLAIGLMVYTVLSQDIEFGSAEFYALLALTIAQVVVAIVLAVISSTIVGSVITAVLALIDILLTTLCEADVIDKDGAAGFLFNGLSALLVQGLAFVINDYTPLVDLSKENRLDVQLNSPTLIKATGEDGFIKGNQINLSGVITSTLHRGYPNWMGYTYPWQLNDSNLAESTFQYEIQSNQNTMNLSLNGTNWQAVPGRKSVTASDPLPSDARYYQQFDLDKTYTLNTTGVNESLPVYLSEGFIMNAQNCWTVPIPVPPYVAPVCYVEDYEDTFHTDLSADFQFDVLPNSIDGFRSLTKVGDSARLSWDSQFPILVDGDNDGLISKAKGGVDPNDASPDADADGLPDYYEYYNGFDPEDPDADQDGLTDYWEAFYGTNPNRSDTDQDGLSDYHEFFHPNTVHPFLNSNTPNWADDVSDWAGGWDMVYDFKSNGQPLTFWVSADPNTYDTDDDGVSDTQEKVYGYNPNISQELKVLSLSSAIDTSGAEPPYVAPGGSITYTASITNELDNRYARGLLQAEFPIDTVVKTQVITTLNPLSAVDMQGVVNVDSGINTSFVTSMTIRAGAIIDEGTDRIVWLRMHESSGSEFSDSSLLGHHATCTNCPDANGQYLTFGKDGEDLAVDTTGPNFERNSFSVGAWVFPTGTSLSGVILEEPNRYKLDFHTALIPRIQVYLTGNQTVQASGGILTPARWNHVMFTYFYNPDTQTTEIDLYIDGEKVNSDSDSGQTIRSTPTILEIGSSFNGRMDDVEFFGDTLTADEVRSLVSLPVLDMDFTNLEDDSESDASISCAGFRCPTPGDNFASFDQDDYLTVSDSALNLSGGQFAIATWIKPGSRPAPYHSDVRSAYSSRFPDSAWDWQAVFGSNGSDGVSSDNSYPSLYVSYNGHLWMGFSNGGQSCSFMTQSGLVDRGQQRHVVINFDGTIFTVYINGEEKASNADSPCNGVTPPNTSAFTIGRPNSNSYVYFDRVYADEIDDGVAGGAEEQRFAVDNVQRWSKDVANENQNYEINYRLLETGGNNHTFKLWEYDPIGANDTFIGTTTFNTITPKNTSTHYSNDGSVGDLYWGVNNDNFYGDILTFELYDNDLTPSKVENLFNALSSGLDLPVDEPPSKDTLADLSGNGFLVTCSQFNATCPDTGIPGLDNQALRFDGGLSDDDGYDGQADYMTIGATTSQLGFFNASFTALAWIKADMISNKQAVFGTHSGTELSLGLESGSPFIQFGTDKNLGSSAISANEWTHLAWVYDKEAQQQHLYVNGTLDTSFSNISTFNAIVDVELGRSLGGSYFDGMLDQIKVFKYVLDADDIQDLMREAPLVNLHLDESLGTSIFSNDGFNDNQALCLGDACPAPGDKGQMRESAVFDGDDMLTIDNLDLDKNKFSLGMWMYNRHIDPQNDEQYLFVVKEGDSNRFELFMDRDGQLVFGATGHCDEPRHVSEPSPGPRHTLHYVPNLITTRRWQHILFTFDEPLITVYYNGQEAIAFDIFDDWGTTCTNPLNVEIGNQLIGNIDELTLYDSIVSKERAEALYDYQIAWFDVSEDHIIRVDADAPQVSLDLDVDHISPESRVMLVAVEDESPIAEVEYRIDGSAWNSITPDEDTWPFTYNAISPGPHTIDMRATDMAGLSSGIVSRVITVDDTPPTITVDSSVSPGIKSVAQTFNLNGTITDADSGVDAMATHTEVFDRHGNAIAGLQFATVSGDDWQVDYPFAVAPYGQYTLQVTGQDNVGHVITKTAPLFLDSYGPYADVVMPITLITQSVTSVISGTAADILHLPQSRSLFLHFEEAAGATTFGDGSRNQFSGTCSGSTCPTAGQSGHYGNALNFDGLDDQLNISGTFATSVTQHLGLQNNSFTVMTWLNADNLTGDRAVLGAGINSDNAGLLAGLRDGKPHLSFVNDDTTSANTLNTGQWYHLAWRYDDGVGEQALFVDGTLVMTATGHNAFLGTGTVSVGQALGGNNFDGLLDELAIYNTALSNDKIYDIANPLSNGVNLVEVRFRHGSEADQIAINEGTWYPATLADPEMLFSTWSLSMPQTLEGPYRIDLLTTDITGNQSLILDAWNGTIDLLAPRLTFIYEPLDGQSGDETLLRCQAVDYNLVEDGWVCPLDISVREEIYQDEAWFVSLFSDTQKLAEMSTPVFTTVVAEANTNVTLTACDIFGNCATEVAAQAPGAPVNNLQLWLKAGAGTDSTISGTTVMTWTDQSGRGHIATQNDGGQQPIYLTDALNGYPVLRFDAANDSLLVGDTLSLDSAYTIFAVFNTNGSAVARRAVQSQDINWLIGPYNGEVRHYAGSWVSQGYALEQGQFYLTTARNDQTVSTFWVDGVDRTTDSTPTSSPQRLGFGAFGTYQQPLGGDLAEVIAFDTALSATERQQVESYLALKYGLTLGDNDHYRSSNGTIIWNADANAGYYHDVAAIGRDNSSDLAQWQSRSSNDDAIVTVTQGHNFASPQPSYNDQSFLIWGNNNGLLTATTTITVNGVAYEKLDRQWRVQTTGNLSDTAIAFDLSGLGYDLNEAWIALVRADNSTFSSQVSLQTDPDIEEDVISFNDLQFSDGQYFSLLVAPGNNLSLFDRVPEAIDYSIVYGLNLPENADYLVTAPDYFIDRSDVVGSYDRVAYYLELQSMATGAITWVYVSIPRLTLDPDLIGIPITSNDVSFERTTSDMVVLSNDPNIVTGTIETGNVEFWPGDSNPSADSGLGGSNTSHDFDDQQGDGNRGSFQIHNYGAGQTIIAWNGWGDSTADDLGIGNHNGTHPDWTNAANSNDYNLRRLYVLARYGVVGFDDTYTSTQAAVFIEPAPGVLSNDISALDVSLLTPPNNGGLTLNSDGSFIYTPTTTFIGNDIFHYISQDGAVTDTATVTITVTPANCFVEATGDNFTDYASFDSSALQAAHNAANEGDTLKVAGTCLGVSGLDPAASLTQTLYISKSLTVQGGYTMSNWLADPDTTLYPTTLDADQGGRVIYVSDNVTVTLSHLTISGGNYDGNGEGAGIYNAGSLTVTHSILADNRLIAVFANSARGGAIYNDNSLIVVNSVFTNNQAIGWRVNFDDADGGAIYNKRDADIQISGSLFTDNLADTGGAIYNDGTGMVINNTFYNNTAELTGGAIFGYQRLNVLHNTIAGNQTGTLDTNDSRVGGIHVLETAYLGNNIIANNTPFDCSDEGQNILRFLFYVENIIETTPDDSLTRCFPDFTDDPQLGPLADNGGETQTMAITAISPAYNAGAQGLCPATDQRGFARSEGNICDLGAYEAEEIDERILKTVLEPNTAIGETITYTVRFWNSSSTTTLTGLEVTDVMPPEIISVTHESALDSGVVITYTASNPHTWQVSNLTPGQGGVITLTGQVDIATPLHTVITNTATITTTTINADLSNNVSTVSSYACLSKAITVTNALDSGPGSLRQAIDDVCHQGTITFADDYTIYLDSTLSLNTHFSIDGGDQQIFISGDSGNDGDRDVRVIMVESTADVTLRGLNIVSGTAQGGSFVDTLGGGIYNENGTLSLENLTLYDNVAAGWGGGLNADGDEAVTTIYNSTVVGNSAAAAGGVNAISNAQLTLYNVTIANNTAGWIGGLHAGDGETGAFVQIYNSIIANNVGTDPMFTEMNCFNANGTASVGDNINNLIEGGECNEGTTVTNLLSADPLLGSLDYHGGNTLSYALQPNSPALTSGDAATCLTVDQRGQSRLDFGATCDLGAYELGGADLLITKQVTPTLLVYGDSITYTLQLTNTGSITATNIVVTDYLPNQLSDQLTIDSTIIISQSNSNDTISWGINDLAPGASGTIILSSVVDSAGVIYNTATVDSPDDVTTANNTASVSSRACQTDGVVTSANDSGLGTLREMISDDCITHITFADDYTIYLSSTLEITHDLTIDGGNQTIIISGDSNGDGDHNVQPFFVHTDTTVSMNHLSVISGTGVTGGGILNAGTLTISEMILRDNQATSGGGIYNAISATLTLSNSTLYENSSSQLGGGIYSAGSLTMGNSTVVSNTATSNGHGLYLTSTTVISNSTLFANTSANGATSALFADSGATMHLFNTIIAGSDSATDCDVDGTLATNSNNLVEDGGCSAALSSDPLLEPLADNGGDTLTLALHPSSPAIDAGDVATCLSHDQRGLIRTQGSVCDIGAFELIQPKLNLTKQVSYPYFYPGNAVTYTLTFSNSGDGVAEDVTISDILPSEFISATYEAMVDGGLILTPTANTTFTWSLSGSLTTGQSGTIIITVQSSETVKADVITNTATFAAKLGGIQPISTTADIVLNTLNVAPVVASEIFTISESALAGLVIGTIQASDENLDDLTYTIIDGDPNGVFDLDSVSGQLTISDTANLNYEGQDQYQLIVTVADNAGPITNTVIVNVTDTESDLHLIKTVTPTLLAPGDPLTYTLTFSNTGSDFASDVALVDTMLDHMTGISYQLALSGVTPIQFTDGLTTAWLLGDLGPNTGGVFTLTGWLKKPHPVTTLTNTAIITTASADSTPADNQSSASFTVINVAPVVTPTTESVPEATINGVTVGYVDAADDNGDSLTYTLMGGNDGTFVLDMTTGHIIVADHSQLNAQTTPQYTLTVAVSDSVFTETNTILINVNEVDFDLSVVKTVSPPTALPGETITYTLAFSNSGTDPTYGLVITDDLPSGLTVQQVISDASVAITRTVSTSQTESFSLDILAGGESGTITITAQISHGLSLGTDLTNTVVITSIFLEDDNENNRAQATLPICQTDPVVTNSNDSGTGSLRQALIDSCPDSVITFDTVISGQIISLASQLEIDKAVTIRGTVPVTISGNNAVRVFNVAANTVDVIFEGLVISDGSASGDGGGIFAASGTTVTISQTTFLNNTSTNAGGGLSAAGITTIAQSTFAYNQTRFGGGIDIKTGGVMTVSNSTFFSNTATEDGGGLIVAGGATGHIYHSTFAENAAQSGGGLRMGGGATLQNLQNTIVANSVSGGDCSGSPVVSLGNLISDGGCSATQSGDPRLSNLGHYGGLTDGGVAMLTLGLLPNSPAIDKGSAGMCALVDQRGISRSGACDIGAFEAQGYSFVKTNGDNQVAPLNSPFAEGLGVQLFHDVVNTPVGAGASITFTAPISGPSLITNTWTSTTDSNGSVRAVVTANNEIGDYQVIASTAGLSDTINFNLRNDVFYTVITALAGNGNGDFTLDPPGNFYQTGTVITLTATPDIGSYFAGWSGDLTGVTNPVTMAVTSDVAITATFEIVTHTLTISTAGMGSGSVTLEPVGNVYNYGTVVTLTASPDVGSYFVGWSGNISHTSAVITTTMIQDVHLTATFAIVTHTLSVTTIGDGSGLINFEPDGGVYDYGTVVTLTVTPSVGSYFEGWSGDVNDMNLTVIVTMTQDINLLAAFDLLTYTVNVNTAGDGNGAITFSPSGGVYDYGSLVTVSATPDFSSTFTTWSGDLSSALNSETLIIDADKVVTATFTALPTYTLTVHVIGNGAVTPSNGTYLAGQIVPLTTTPAAGWAFEHWDGNLSGHDNPVSLTMDQHKVITATFSELPVLVDLSITQAVSPPAVNPDDVVTVGLSLQNTSTATATGVVITYQVPSQISVISLISTSNTGIVHSGSFSDVVVFTLDELGPSQGDFIGITLQVDAVVRSGSVTNSVTISANETDSMLSNNTAISTLTVHNLVPRFSLIDNLMVTKPTLVSQTITATDGNGENLTYSLLSGPSGATLDQQTGHLQWSISNQQNVGDYAVTIAVHDDGTPVLSDTATFTITVQNPPILLDPNTSTTATIPITDGVTVEITAPAGAVGQSVRLEYTILSAVNGAPDGFIFVGVAFDLTAFVNDQVQNSFTFDQPIMLTLSYTDIQIAGIDENSLSLYYFDEASSSWRTDGITIVERDVDNNRLRVSISHLTTFGLFGRENEIGDEINLYFPLVIRHSESP